MRSRHANGELQFFGDLLPLCDPTAFARHLAPLQHKKWVVYAKAPFGGPQHMLEYLGRYTHRVAIVTASIIVVSEPSYHPAAWLRPWRADVRKRRPILASPMPAARPP
jgi:hypothetical protein